MNGADSTQITDAVGRYAKERNISGMGVSSEIFQDAGQPVGQSFNEQPSRFNPARVQAVLEGDYAHEWQQVRDILEHDVFAYAYDETSEAARALAKGSTARQSHL